jgi:hypothetical protein
VGIDRVVGDESGARGVPVVVHEERRVDVHNSVLPAWAFNDRSNVELVAVDVIFARNWADLSGVGGSCILLVLKSEA